MNTFAIGLADIKLRITRINGVATTTIFSGASAVVSIGEVMEGSTTINDDAPTETKFKGDYTDATLFALFQRGDFTMETDIISVDGAKFSALTGGTWNAGTKTIGVPDTAPNIEGEVVLEFDQGVRRLRFNRAQIVANYSGANLKTEMFKLHLKVIGLADANQNVAEIILA